MSAQPHVDDNFTFVGGLNTEGGYFVTPKNSWVEGQNVVPQMDGSVERRPAIDLEEEGDPISAFTYSSSQIINNVVAVEMWTSVAGNGNVDYFVVQIGTLVYFYKAYSGTVSARPVIGVFYDPEFVGPVNPAAGLGFDLTAFRCADNTGLIYDSPISTASVYGNLVITHRDCDPILVTNTPGSDTYTFNRLRLKIRDLKGITSSEDVTVEKTYADWGDFGPSALYNLYNQGWSDEHLTAYSAANSGLLPANTKQWIYGKDTNDDFDASVLAKVDFGSTPAPRGRYILEAFYEDRASSLSQTQAGSGAVNTGDYEDPLNPTPGYEGSSNDLIYFDPP